MPGAKMTTTVHARIVELRRAGWSCREVAAEVGVTESAVWQAMRREGLNGAIRAKPDRKPDVPRNVGRAVEEYGHIAIEATLDGRYEVTIDEEVTGPPRGSLQGAIYAAAREYQKAHGGQDVFDIEEEDWEEVE